MRREHYNIQTKTVYVDGNIFLNNTIAKPILDIGAYFSESDFDHIDKIIGGDFILDNDAETSENTYYYAAGDVVSDIAGCGFYSRYHPLLSYDKSIDDIITLSLLDVAEGKDILNRMLFANVYSVMEVFLQDINIHLVTGIKKFRNNYIAYRGINTNNKPKNIIDKKVMNRIVSENYQKLHGNIRDLFNNVFGVTLPEYNYIERKKTVRHDIVHRNGAEKYTGNIHRIDNKMLYELIENVDSFVHKLFAEFEELD